MIEKVLKSLKDRTNEQKVVKINEKRIEKKGYANAPFLFTCICLDKNLIEI